ncbi:MAG TPA: hypothetical protein VJA94_08470 [Candidatus Angelobacter sp.]
MIFKRLNPSFALRFLYFGFDLAFGLKIKNQQSEINNSPLLRVGRFWFFPALHIRVGSRSFAAKWF